ncbi:MAG: hypothetical protein ACRC92_21815 [Peptostreptococcaceae bacterium]
MINCKQCKWFVDIHKTNTYSKNIGIGFCNYDNMCFERIYEGEDNSEFMECDIEKESVTCK